MRGDWESWLLPLSLSWMWWEPTPGAGGGEAGSEDFLTATPGTQQGLGHWG